MTDRPSLEALLGAYRPAVDARVEDWRRRGVMERLLAHDTTLWSEQPMPELDDRLGWLALPRVSEEVLGDWIGFAGAEREGGLERVVVLGMGGSSLAPEVFGRVLGDEGCLVVQDTTQPDAIAALADSLDVERTLFVVSSKSGSTIETRTLFEYFWRRAGTDARDAGRRFVVVTDPGSQLEDLAAGRRVHRIFRAPEDVGGRYSALTAFGMVPAALAGVDIRELVARARRAADDLVDAGRAGDHLVLGALLGELAIAGRDKLTLATSAELRSFPDWLEQLVAESTGKLGRGIVPVVGETLAAPGSYGDDRLFVAVLTADDRGDELERHHRALAEHGHPVVLITLRDAYDLGFEMFRWEVAVALAGSVMELNPFNQPNVQLAKEMAQKAIDGQSLGGSLGEMERLEGAAASARALAGWLPQGPPAYVAVQAYVEPGPTADRALARLQGAIGRATGCATTVGYGPRFLHSTGQLHKGGPATAWCLQVTVDVAHDIDIPGESLSFGELIAAQADGDAAALLDRNRPVARVHLSSTSELSRLADRVEEGTP